MKAKILTATAFSLLMAVGAASAQSTSDSNQGQGATIGSSGQQPTNSTSSNSGGNPAGAPVGVQQIDPSITNSTDSDSDRDCITATGTTKPGERGPDGKCVE